MRREINKTEETGNKPEIGWPRKPLQSQVTGGLLRSMFGLTRFREMGEKNEDQIGKKTGHFCALTRYLFIFKIFGMPKLQSSVVRGSRKCLGLRSWLFILKPLKIKMADIIKISIEFTPQSVNDLLIIPDKLPA